MFENKNLENVTFKGFKSDIKGRNFLLEKIQNLIEKLPYDSNFSVHFQKKGKECFCSFKAISVNATFFAIVSGTSVLDLEKKVNSGIKKQIIDWYNFRTQKNEKTPKRFKRFVPKRFTFFNQREGQKSSEYGSVLKMSSRLKTHKAKKSKTKATRTPLSKIKTNKIKSKRKRKIS